ncbi:bifunctional bis(5'-adenosyl)-triphosphatase/adenylylsulfatase FHIT-like isoform X2 [Nicotiana tabacum]|uniref:Bifunctional bis(5'-adenosyl)-triphosphatase/adenylylsulfatase FHIT-like isoform X2 n=1 Tax=Nicotiana tabacum TaxID=4097 RepID=A0A1S3ZW00_TOBAC|nr:PREDICTED: bis(5'-adenosyl)-triphosphatase-like isoform X2 [Nicotiana tabacum]XP_018634434.1 bifunctional bis(5'-adenosyl)-triphosphatase/adenylylsulfatase FHIT isoform X2 [Nicotiana tomentosiformis]
MLKLLSFVSSHNFTPLSNFIGGIQFQSAFTPTNHFFHLARVFSSISHSHSKMEADSYMFGPYKIDKKEVFYSTDLSYALVNLRPLLPGHVLVCPRREAKRFADLTADETSDLWLTAQKVGKQLESYHKASSLTFAIQLDVKEKEMKQSLDLDKERKDRSIEEMAEEAAEYRKLL